MYLKIFLTILMLFTFTTQISLASAFLFRIHGSNTIGSKLAPALVKGYLKEKGATHIKEIEINDEDKEIHALTKNGKKIKVEIKAHGSSTGFQDLNQNLCDIAIASRRIKDSEKKLLKRFGNMKDIENEHIIAIDGIAMLVNKNNPIKSLSIQQIQDIYRGKITNWNQISQREGKINCYARDKNSGTWDTFNTLVLHKNHLTNNVKRYQNNTKLSEDISKDINGIGFGGIPYILNTKALAIKESNTVISPNTFTIATEDYPLSRRLYMYNTDNIKKSINTFIEFTLSSKGQKIVNKINFVDLNIKEFTLDKNQKVPRKYKKLVKNLTRLSTSFRFEDDSESLDNKALRDIHRISNYLKKHHIYKKDIYLIGFTNNRSYKSINKIYSLKKAKSISYGLTYNNIFIHKKNIIGCGQCYPIAKSHTKNRRVEVWIRR